MINYDKSEVREQLDNEDVFQLLLEWEGNLNTLVSGFSPQLFVIMNLELEVVNFIITLIVDYFSVILVVMLTLMYLNYVEKLQKFNGD